MTDLHDDKSRAKVLNRLAERLGVPHRLDRMADRGDEQQLLCLIVEALAERLPAEEVSPEVPPRFPRGAPEVPPQRSPETPALGPGQAGR